MLSWFDKMEKKVGRYAISNLTLYLLIAYGIGYMTRFLMPELLQWLTLEPGLILKGQIWRIVSWIFVAPAEKPIYFLLMVWLYYSLGTTLERTWGTFRYNVYIISGMLFTVIGAFVLYGVLCATYDAAFIGGQTLLLTGSGLFSVSYIYMSIFLAFAVTYPDMEVLLYFIIPIKMKWMGLVYGVMILYGIISGSMVTRIAIIASILNFIIFFFLFSFFAQAQKDTVNLTLKSAELLLFERNLTLIAEKYNIDIAEAQIQQAKLFENPTILLEQNIYNRLNNKYFDVGKNGEAAIEIEQAIHLAGQRKKQTKLEKINKDIAQYQFEETLRILHGELNEIFIETYFLQKTIKIYNKETISLENLLTGMKIQFQKGNISFLEISRLESMLLSLKKEKNEQENSLFLF